MQIQIGEQIMATNPRIPSGPSSPENEKRPQLVSGPSPKRPGSGVPGLFFALVVAAALIAAIVYYMPRAPRKTPPPSAAQVPTQPVANQLQFSGMRITPAPTGGAVTLQGLVMNTGNRPVIGATVQLTFQNAGGTVLGSVTAPLIGMAQKQGTLETDEFSKNPLKPNDTRPFQVTASQIPAGWNHTMPQLKVLTVSAEGNR